MNNVDRICIANLNNIPQTKTKIQTVIIEQFKIGLVLFFVWFGYSLWK